MWHKVSKGVSKQEVGMEARKEEASKQASN